MQRARAINLPLTPPVLVMGNFMAGARVSAAHKMLKKKQQKKTSGKATGRDCNPQLFVLESQGEGLGALGDGCDLTLIVWARMYARDVLLEFLRAVQIFFFFFTSSAGVCTDVYVQVSESRECV